VRGHPSLARDARAEVSAQWAMQIITAGPGSAQGKGPGSAQGKERAALPRLR